MVRVTRKVARSRPESEGEKGSQRFRERHCPHLSKVLARQAARYVHMPEAVLETSAHLVRVARQRGKIVRPHLKKVSAITRSAATPEEGVRHDQVDGQTSIGTLSRIGTYV